MGFNFICGEALMSWLNVLIWFASTFLLFIPALCFWAFVIWMLFGDSNIKIGKNSEFEKRMNDLEFDRKHYESKVS